MFTRKEECVSTSDGRCSCRYQHRSFQAACCFDLVLHGMSSIVWNTISTERTDTFCSSTKKTAGCTLLSSHVISQNVTVLSQECERAAVKVFELTQLLFLSTITIDKLTCII